MLYPSTGEYLPVSDAMMAVIDKYGKDSYHWDAIDGDVLGQFHHIQRQAGDASRLLFARLR